MTQGFWGRAITGAALGVAMLGGAFGAMARI